MRETASTPEPLPMVKSVAFCIIPFMSKVAFVLMSASSDPTFTSEEPSLGSMLAMSSGLTEDEAS